MCLGDGHKGGTGDDSDDRRRGTNVPGSFHTMALFRASRAVLD